ncbi:MAG: exodeoxyribonuclease III [Candidatus Altiarchaeota archaeon]|nr:exodeoxyribonuclease III [Candidatus Altiarchaeota archaeon]
MKILSWNVNGYRAAVRKGFYDTLAELKPDTLCVQEIKMSDKPTLPLGSDYRLYWNPADKPGYAGTAVFSKLEPLSAKTGLGKKEFDSEGRTQTLEFENFYLLNFYFPHARRGLERLDFKLAFNKLAQKHIAKLAKKKPVIVCGDLNVAHQDIDIARPKDNRKNAGFTQQERDWMTSFLSAGFIDCFRHKHPELVKYSWWSYRFNARARNIGWRIDYLIVSSELEKQIKQAFVLDNIAGSDHAPTGIVI